jgi:hypothetical protein
MTDNAASQDAITQAVNDFLLYSWIFAERDESDESAAESSERE